MNKKTKKIALTTLSMALATIFVPTMSYMANHDVFAIFAQGVAETTQGIVNFAQGNASITLNGNKQQTLVNKKFALYKLFDAQNATNLESVNYKVNPMYMPALQKVVAKKLGKTENLVTEYEIIDYMQTMNTNKVVGANTEQKLEGSTSEFRYFVEEVKQALVELKLKGEEVHIKDTKPDGSIEFSGLAYGYYIIDEISATPGTHSASSLCMVNTANPKATIQIKSDYPVIVKKIQEDDQNVGWNDIGDYEIGQRVPYKYETKVPNINGYAKYYFAFHDKMDEALTFDASSVKIQIQGAAKTYSLKPDEFTIKENYQEETFVVEIKDLKSLVDREFSEFVKNSTDRPYGQTITLTYDAHLNDKASKRTGRAGFENDVQLEFSNNPETGYETETGKTPWDTVVCFTYKLEGLKTNDHDQVLKGAKFKLFYDAECKDEVKVVQGEDGYVVVNKDSIKEQKFVDIVSNEQGVFNIIGLDQGSYYLKEVQAPDGYRQLVDPIKLSVVPTFTDQRNAYNKGEGATEQTLKALQVDTFTKSFYDGKYNEKNESLQTNVENGTFQLKIINKVSSKLPVTGSSITMLMFASGLCLMFVSVAHKRRHLSKEDE